MSTVRTNAILDASGGNTATINSMTPTADSLQGFRNRLINGSMVIDQRNAGASVTPTASGYTLDRWRAGLSVSSKFSVQQSSTAPTGFKNSLLVTSLSAYSVGSGELFGITQRIEGFNTADLMWGTANAKTVTVSFWVRSSLTGNFGGSLYNGNADRFYPFTYAISAANTFEYKTVTIAGDTTGTWATDNTTGLQLIFGLGMGSSISGTAGAWTGPTAYVPTSSVSVVGTNGATFYVTGVQLEVGSVATPFERRDYGRELAMCQRYYTKLSSFVTSGQILSGFSTTATASWCQVFTPVAFRASPTIGFSGLNLSDQVNYGLTITAIAGSAQTINGGGVAFTNNTGATAFRPCAINTATSSGYLDFSAEL